MTNIFQGKSILVTGATGSIGTEIVRKLVTYRPHVVRALSNDENGLFCLERELGKQSIVRFLLGDVRDEKRLGMAAEGIDFIFHVAALKHVPLCEYNPFEAVKVNTLGTQNLIEAAMQEDVQKFITISTDKAVNPVSVMGATKLLSERLTIAANYYKGARKTVFSCVRFGNVLDSRGSIVPVLREQISKGGPVTITDPEMTRFVMSIPRAVELVLKAADVAQGSEIFILKMPALRLGDLVRAVIADQAPRCGYKPADIRIEITGKRPGEKAHEELMTEDEAERAEDSDDMYVVPSMMAERKSRHRKLPMKKYSSQNAPLLSKQELKSLLREPRHCT